MPSFQFTARDSSGRMQSGVAVSGSALNLAGELRQRGLLVLEVKQQEDRRTVRSGYTLNPLTWLPPTSLDIEIGLQQLASMLRSGLSLLSALSTVAEQARRPSMAKIWRDVYERIEEGASLSEAMQAHGHLFAGYIVQLVKVGEQSGTMELVLTRGADHLERSRNLRMTILNALIYPAIVIVVALGTAAFLLLSVIPKIQKFLSGQGRSLPTVTQALLDISNWLTVHLPLLGITLLSAVVALFFVYRWEPGRAVIDSFLLRIPILSGVLRLAGTAIFARGMSILLESGVTLLEALRTVERLLKNRAQRNRISTLRDEVLQGGTLAEALLRGNEFMPMLARMTAVGEATGTLDAVLTEVAQFHESQLHATVRRLSVLVEPAIIFIVGGIVGFVYISFFVAMFSMVGGR